jgi:hypothetical protein
MASRRAGKRLAAFSFTLYAVHYPLNSANPNSETGPGSRLAYSRRTTRHAIALA